MRRSDNVAIYTTAEQDARDLLAAVMKQHHPEFVEVGVRVNVLMATRARDEKTGEPKGESALRHHGWPAQALIKINGHRDRVAGKADADLYLDAERWDELTQRQRQALLHHELLHLEIQSDEDGNVVLDDCNRPKLRIRPHDYQMGGFYQVAEDYGADAPEVLTLADVNRKYVQLNLFDLVSEPVPA
jgi:hypothetical protein